MHNYDNEYTQRGYETNYEFNPEYESESENFENEFNNESESEYGLNPEFNNEQNFEGETRNAVVRDHRSGSVHSSGASNPYRSSSAGRVVVPSRSGQHYPRSSYYRSPSYRTAGSGYYRQSAFQRPYYQGGWQNNRFWDPQWRRWRNRYPQSYNNYSGVGSADQSYQDPQQGMDTGASQAAGPGGNVPNYILDTIKNLSQQVAATNANIEAIQNSIAGQGKPDASQMPPGGNSAPAAGQTGMPVGNPGQPPAGSQEMEDYEYNMENEMMNGGGHELNEMELAAELLATNNEMELDHFLGGLVGGGLSNLLKGVIKKALPIAGAAAGTFFGGPIGATIGQQVGSAASGMFELELEGLSNEDQEFEVAKAIIRLAKDASTELVNGNSTGDPDEDAKNALIQSATRNAPGILMKKHHHHHHHHHGHGGHWHRHGNKIVIENAF